MLGGTFLSSYQGFTHTMNYWEASRKAGMMLQACGSLEAVEDGSIWLVWFIFFLHPLRTWLPS